MSEATVQANSGPGPRPDGRTEQSSGASRRASWWAAVAAIAATYGYFLIFAEFAFLELARTVAPSPERLRLIMLGLGVGGVAGAVLAARRFRPERARRQLAMGFRASALAAGLALLATTPWAAFAVAVVVGLSLGGLTVTLSAALRGAAGGARLGLCIGCGTGLAYGCCNVPWVFQASPVAQTLVAAAVALTASLAPRWMMVSAQPCSVAGEPDRRRIREEDTIAGEADYRAGGVARWVIVLLALVWMDSAAFYIVQHTPALRAATWGNPWLLYGNATVHLLAAAAAGGLLDRGVRGALVGAATAALAGACLILDGRLPALVPAAWFYTAGVSMYSTVLVYYPARSGRAGIAALVFAVAGWLGSALGIGMAQDLGRVPLAFVVVAGAVITAVLFWRIRTLRRVAVAAAVAIIGSAGVRAGETDPTVARGREIYIAEGCIHCHSQYVRPRDPLDRERWGPALPLRDALAVAPPLFGNRRQGPDLANIGNRRSPEWNRLHLIAPRTVSPGSRMPSYAHLFAPGDERGEVLLAYLAALGVETRAERRAQIIAWTPDTRSVLPLDDARRLFQRMCAPCHGTAGRGDGVVAAKLSLRPPDWTATAWRHVPPAAPLEPALSRTIKFGLPGLPMPGHEYLPDHEVVGLARFVQTLHERDQPASIAAVQP